MTFRDRVTELRRVRAGDLLANPLNWRRHPAKQRTALESVLAEIGFAGALVARVDDDGESLRLIDGHLRADIDPGAEVPVLVTDLNEDEANALLATFDPLGAMAETDADVLEDLLRDVGTAFAGLGDVVDLVAEAFEVDLSEPGAVGDDPGAQVDRAEELLEKWQVERGDLWAIPSAHGGVHRLLCGDCTVERDVARVMNGEKAKGVFTSPPYAEQRKNQYGGIPTDEYVDWWKNVQSAIQLVLDQKACFFVNIKPHVEDHERSLYVFDLVSAMKRKWGWMFIEEFCWLRSGVPKKVQYRFKNAFEPIYQFAFTHEFNFYPQAVQHDSYNVPIALGAGAGDTRAANRQGSGGDLFGINQISEGKAYPANVLKAFSNKEALGHPAAFAVELVQFFLLAYSVETDRWLDPFSGSGTVFVACENNERLASGVELLPKYCAVILERLAGMGLEPRRWSDGCGGDAGGGVGVFEVV